MQKLSKKIGDLAFIFITLLAIGGCNANNTYNTQNMTNDFLMPIEDVFEIQGKGTVITGRVQSGSVTINDEVKISGIYPIRKVKVIGIQNLFSDVTVANAGDNTGLILADIQASQIAPKEMVTK